MATIKRALSAKTNPSGRAEIMLRVSVSHSVSHRIKSGLFIKKELFKDNKFSNPRDPELKKEVRDIQDRLDEIEKFLIRICEDTPLNKVTKDFLLTQLDMFLNPPVEDAHTSFLIPYKFPSTAPPWSGLKSGRRFFLPPCLFSPAGLRQK